MQIDDVTPDDENPEWTDTDFARARHGAPWLWQARQKRDDARALRELADRLDAEADRLERPPRLPARAES